MGEWYENESRYTHVGFVETGEHSIYEFEIYRDRRTNDLVCLDHEDPDAPVSLSEVREFFKERGDYGVFEAEIRKVVLDQANEVIERILK